MAKWKDGTAGDFLGLSNSAAALVEALVLLAQRLHELCKERSITQAELARMEAASQVTLDMLCRAWRECGATLAEIVQVFCEAGEQVGEVRARNEQKIVVY